jgi:hypothetical protein
MERGCKKMNTVSLSVDPTSIGILIAALALWAQLWVNYAGDDKKQDKTPNLKTGERQRIVSIGLTWIYTAIWFGFVAFIISIISISNLSKGLISLSHHATQILFLNSLIMGLINISESTFTLGGKLKLGKTHNDMKEISEKDYKKSFSWMIFLIIFTLLGSFLAVVCGIWYGILAWVIVLIAGFKLLKSMPEAS